MTLLQASGLRVELGRTGIDIVDGVSFEIAHGEVVGLVGESGSGKTTTGTALLGHARRGARISDGRVTIDGRDLLGLSTGQLRDVRGSLIAYVPQDPAAALNPALRIKQQLTETLAAHHRGTSDRERQDMIRIALDEVKLPTSTAFLRRYPHQLSGGQQQRICIAMAFVCRPRVVVLDEPTTGLDVTTQAHVLDTVRELTTRHAVAALYVTHDLAVVSNIADRVIVMYAGRVVEIGSRRDVFERPAHPYTRALLSASPDIAARRELHSIPGRAPSPNTRPAGCTFAQRCDFAVTACTTAEPSLASLSSSPEHHARCIRADEVEHAPIVATAPIRTRAPTAESVLRIEDLHVSYGSTKIIHGVSLDLPAATCVALVGESGSGKTTVARSIIGLLSPDAGRILFKNEPLAAAARERPLPARRSLQYIFQSPYNSLNPRQTVADIIGMPMKYLHDHGRRETRHRVGVALDRVALDDTIGSRYPDELSGGERQRVAIARALVCEPEILICDEITSALDVSVQATIIELLNGLRWDIGLSMIFVTHNLALVRTIADRVAVMEQGRIVEDGPTDDVLDQPAHAYTRELLAHTPRVSAGPASR